MRFFTFSDELEPVQLEEYFAKRAPIGTTTDVATALLESANVPPNQTLAGALFISDGRDNSGNDARRAALMLKGANAAVWTTVVGNATETQDVYVTARLKQSYLFVDQPGAIAVTVSQTGFEGKYATVTLFREEQNVATQQVVMNGAGASIEFPVREKQKGLVRFRVEVEPLGRVERP